MSKIDWLKELTWGEAQLEELSLAGFAYIRQGKYDIALPLFEALAILEPLNPYNAQTLGALYLELGNPAKAIKVLDDALKLDTDHTPTLLNLTKAFFMLGKKAEGLKLAEILRQEPDLKVANAASALLLAFS